MADRYWVGGSGAWDRTTTTHWSTSSGGSGGASVPTATDNAIFDSGSNNASYTVTLTDMGGTDPTTQGNCLDFIVTAPSSGNVTFTIALSREILLVWGNCSWYSGMIANTVDHVAFYSVAASTLTTNGVKWQGIMIVRTDAAASLTLQDDLDVGTGVFDVQGGTFDANNKNVTADQFLFNQSFDRTIIMGTGTWTAGSGGWSFGSIVAGHTINIVLPTPASASTIKFAGNMGSDFTFDTRYHDTGTRAYGTIEVATTGAGHLIIVGNNTFDTLKISGVARTIQFGNNLGSGYTTHITTLQCSGTVGNLNVFQPYTTNAYNFVKDGGGIVSNDYLSLSYCHASPTTTWYAGTHSMDGGNNTGWYFQNPSIQASVSGVLSFGGSLSTNHKTISGITKDPSGNTVGNCIVWMMAETDPIQQVMEGTSDSSGNYSFCTAYSGPVRIISYKTGTPNIQGVTDTITPS